MCGSNKRSAQPSSPWIIARGWHRVPQQPRSLAGSASSPEKAARALWERGMCRDVVSRASSATSPGEGGGGMEPHRPLSLSRAVIPVPPYAAPSLSCECSHGCGNRAPPCWEVQSGIGSRELWQSKMWQSCSLWNNPFGRDELAHIDFHNISQFREHP